MKRKEFIKATSALVAGTLVSPLMSCSSSPQEVRKNWADNYQYKAKTLHEPQSADELQELVKKLSSQKALGSKHCFNDIADSAGSQISTKNLNKLLNVVDGTVTVEAGVRYGDFAPQLHERGFALHNLASLPHISVAGACATATHGSGVGNGNLASAVTAIEMVDGTGQLVTLRAGDPDFAGAVVGLGALGIVTKVTLATEKSFDVRQDVFQDLPLQSLQDNFEAIMSSGYSVSLFTDWQNQLVSQVWVKRRTDSEVPDLGGDFYGAKAATRNLHPITRLSAENCTEQLGVPGPWYDRLPHFKMGFTPSSGEELQSEFFVPFDNAVDAILALEKKRDLIYPELMITEIRTIAADNLWLSPCYRQKSVAIHFTWKQNWPGVSQLLPVIQAELAPFGVKPHWGKLFTISRADLAARFEKMADFVSLANRYDPEGKFRNDYLNLNVFGG